MIDTAPTSMPNSSALRCPLCGSLLARDDLWTSPHWLCPEGHSYSNIRVLLAELAERGWLPAGVHEEQPAVSE